MAEIGFGIQDPGYAAEACLSPRLARGDRIRTPAGARKRAAKRPDDVVSAPAPSGSESPVAPSASRSPSSGDSALAAAANEIVARTRREQHLPPTICDPVVLERLAILVGHASERLIAPDKISSRRTK